jgi:hypothetical protein
VRALTAAAVPAWSGTIDAALEAPHLGGAKLHMARAPREPRDRDPPAGLARDRAQDDASHRRDRHSRDAQGHQACPLVRAPTWRTCHACRPEGHALGGGSRLCRIQTRLDAPSASEVACAGAGHTSGVCGTRKPLSLGQTRSWKTLWNARACADIHCLCVNASSFQDGVM